MVTALEQAHAELSLLVQHVGRPACTELDAGSRPAGAPEGLDNSERAELLQLFEDGPSQIPGADTGMPAADGHAGDIAPEGASSPPHEAAEAWARKWEPLLGNSEAAHLLRLARQQPRLLAALAANAGARQAPTLDSTVTPAEADEASSRLAALLQAIAEAQQAVVAELLAEGAIAAAIERVQWLAVPDAASPHARAGLRRVLSQLLEKVPEGELLRVHQAAAARSGSLALLRLLEEARGGLAGQPRAAAAGSGAEAAGLAGEEQPADAHVSGGDAVAAALQAVRESDFGDAAAAVAGRPQELRALVAAAGWDDVVGGSPGAAYSGATALLRALRPLGAQPSEGVANPFRQLLEAVARELLFHLEVAEQVAHASVGGSASEAAQTAAIDAAPSAPTPAGAGERVGGSQEVPATSAGAAQSNPNLAAGEALRRLRSGHSAARVLAELAPALGLPAILGRLEAHQRAETLLVRPAGAAEADERLLRLARAALACAGFCASLAAQAPVQALLQLGGSALEELQEALAALEERLDRLWALNLLAALLRLNPYAIAPASGEAAGGQGTAEVTGPHCIPATVLFVSAAGTKVLLGDAAQCSILPAAESLSKCNLAGRAQGREGTPLNRHQGALDLMSGAVEDEDVEEEEEGKGSQGEELLAQALREAVEAWRPQLAALRQSQGGLGHISGRLHPTWT